MTQATANDVAVELTKLGYETLVLPADPPNSLVDAINIWCPGERFPVDTIWAPMPNPAEHEGPNFMWSWGPNFNYCAQAEALAADIAAQVVATVTR